MYRTMGLLRLSQTCKSQEMQQQKMATYGRVRCLCRTLQGCSKTNLRVSNIKLIELFKTRLDFSRFLWQKLTDYFSLVQHITILYFRYKKKCEEKQVQKCEDVPKIVKEEIHKRVPTQIEGKVAYRVCPGQSDHEYTPTEVRTINFSGY